MVLNTDSTLRALGRIHRTQRVSTPSGLSPLAAGVTVIVPAYKSREYLPALLDSLAAQTLATDLFEVIVVLNGPDDGAADLLVAEHRFELRWYRSAHAGAGTARNLGIRLAQRSYCVFLDVDDTLEPDYLTNAWAAAEPGTVVVNPILDVTPDGTVNASNALNRQITALRGGEIADYPWLLSFNACKLVPTPILQTLRFDESLRSGEDVVFWAGLLAYPHLKVVPARPDNAAYRRLLAADSVSRKEESFDFNVVQRLEVIAAVQRLELGPTVAGPIASRVGAQMSFVRNYMAGHPNEMDELEAAVIRAGVERFAWSDLERPPATQLVFSYCFPPFSDTAGVIAAKVVADRRQYSDVIANDMSSRRRTDHSLDLLASRWIKRAEFLDTPTAFGNWNEIAQYAAGACERGEIWHSGHAYDCIYSRALWPGSHLAAALFKARHPQVEWVAEFSDPLRTDAEGNVRPGKVSDDDVAREVRRACPALNGEDNLFGFIERAAFELADRVIVTNENQLAYMLSFYSPDDAARFARKVEVRPHPAPHPALFDTPTRNLQLSPETINVGYFGSVYANRGFSDVFGALAGSDERIHLHIFTNTFDALKAQVKELGIAHRVHLHPYLPYVEFVGACRQFDVLLATDALAPASMTLNPFLPSKVSDYRASGTPIWAIVQPGSPLSKLDAHYTSTIGDLVSFERALADIATKAPQ
ncbi:glycosyltransferase involved in cell wall biosynthesis [Arcanobacterium wilhelmae]|uniref:Glycosyltransferase involved in cell wall biosynthesis n=1 Tax=Arcanobacterium wilhelmae TaxID=1803177 RepID=A0ABT9NDW0_9ACTO|nr:glycosyltransferase [Arcanobacterium wilhelmae]MDP9801708.1 glycosyltransferase involved in cell wall biosynthesis [Arcanobacterium wilhelmae]WFN91027.1 glycosyltransferase [Arcanobacterium wilhelmae]